MDKFEKGQLTKKLCHSLLKECVEAGFSVADVREIPGRLNEIIEISVMGDDRLFQEAIKKA